VDPCASVVDWNLFVSNLADVAASADAIVRLKDQNRVSEMDQLFRRGETGEPGTDDDHIVATGLVAISAADWPGRLECSLRLRRRAQAKEKRRGRGYDSRPRAGTCCKVSRNGHRNRLLRVLHAGTVDVQ
jgi:hypothetical protein